MPATVQRTAAISSLLRVRAALEEEFGAEPKETEVSEIAAIVAEINGTDVSEIYSPARFCEGAARLGLKPGFSADLDEIGPDG